MRDTPSPAQVAAVVAALDPTVRVDRVRAATNGFVNAVTIVHTTGPAYVVKAPSASWKPAKEQRLHAHFRKIGVPAPQVLAIDDSQAVVPFTWMITECVPGQPWSEVAGTLDGETTRGLYRQLGDILGRFHTTTFDAFGEAHGSPGAMVAGPVHELGGVGPFATWAGLHDAFVAERLAYLRTTTLADLAPAVETYLTANRSLIEGAVTPRLLHMDLHAGNIMVENGQITGILDCEESIIGDAAYDLMRTELAHFRETPLAWQVAFREGYEAHLPIEPSRPERQRYYEVSRTLVWIRSLSAPGRAGQDRAAMERQIRRYLGTLLDAG
jgi:aminoglycoside phosphotransferase (APT) family kinase protein